MSDVVLFAIFSFFAVVGAIAVVSARDPFISALSLIVNFAALGGLFLVLHAPFVAMSQVVVYAGAVVVLFLFVIAYLGDRRELVISPPVLQWVAPVAVLAGLSLVAMLGYAATGGFDGDAIGAFPGKVAASFGSPTEFGEAFLTQYLLEFEATSLVLLVAAIGGVVLGLTGRARHDRLRRLQGTRSADQQRRALKGAPDETVGAP